MKVKRFKNFDRITLYHGVKNEADVEAILKNGFDLSKIHPLWQNDYAVSTLTSPKAVHKFFGKSVPVLELEFEGTLGERPNIIASDAKDYTRQMVKMGIDAVILDSDNNVHQVFVYNPKAIKKITLYKQK